MTVDEKRERFDVAGNYALNYRCISGLGHDCITRFGVERSQLAIL
jgi:hypothetical protein